MNTIGFLGWTFGFILITGNCYQFVNRKSWSGETGLFVFTLLVIWVFLSIVGGAFIASDLRVQSGTGAEYFACMGLVSLLLASIGFSLWKFLSMKEYSAPLKTSLTPYQLYMNVLGVISSVLGILSFFLFFA